MTVARFALLCFALLCFALLCLALWLLLAIYFHTNTYTTYNTYNTYSHYSLFDLIFQMMRLRTLLFNPFNIHLVAKPVLCLSSKQLFNLNVVMINCGFNLNYYLNIFIMLKFHTVLVCFNEELYSIEMN